MRECSKFFLIKMIIRLISDKTSDHWQLTDAARHQLVNIVEHLAAKEPDKHFTPTSGEEEEEEKEE